MHTNGNNHYKIETSPHAWFCEVLQMQHNKKLEGGHE